MKSRSTVFFFLGFCFLKPSSGKFFIVYITLEIHFKYHQIILPEDQKLNSDFFHFIQNMFFLKPLHVGFWIGWPTEKFMTIFFNSCCLGP